MGEKLGGCSWQWGFIKKIKNKNLPLQVPPKKRVTQLLLYSNILLYCIIVTYCKNLCKVYFSNKVDMNE